MSHDEGPTIEERLEKIERRLGELERRVEGAAGRVGTPPVVRRVPEAPETAGAPDTPDTPVAPEIPEAPETPQAPEVSESPESVADAPPSGGPASVPSGPHRGRRRHRRRRDFSAPNVSAALVLGWSGAAALVLAGAYLVRLSIVYGWLTPTLQVTAAAAVGIGLVAGGLVLRIRDRGYAGLLGAAGVAILYLAVFGAHLHHALIGPGTATALAVGVAAVSLGLQALHRGALFVSLALAGSYATPLLVPGHGALADLAVYLTIWNVVYGALALVLGRRAIYLAALYASLLVFDLAALEDPADPWRIEAGFQALQFALFGAVVAAYAVRHGPMAGLLQPLLHYGALLLFYVVEYSILDDHLPALAPWIAVGFAAALYAAWAAVGWMGADEGDRLPSLRVVHAFAALVLFHAVWIDGVPWEWRPAAALALAFALLALPRVRGDLGRAWRPWWTVAGLLFAAGWIHLALGWDVPDREIALAPLLVVLWPVWAYLEYARRPRGRPEDRPPRAVLIGLAHALALAGWALLVERWWGDPASTIERLWLSMGWAAIGVVVLAAAWRRADLLLARSSLGIFALFAGKVVLVDLDRADALVRVGILAVLGAALYTGGWIYRRAIEPQIESAGP